MPWTTRSSNVHSVLVGASHLWIESLQREQAREDNVMQIVLHTSPHSLSVYIRGTFSSQNLL